MKASRKVPFDSVTELLIMVISFKKMNNSISNENNRAMNFGKARVKRAEDEKNKVYRLLDFSENPRDIADPWYTGNFDVTYDDVVEGCEKIMEEFA